MSWLWVVAVALLAAGAVLARWAATEADRAAAAWRQASERTAVTGRELAQVRQELLRLRSRLQRDRR